MSLILTPKQAFEQARKDGASVVAQVDHPIYGPLKVLGYGPKLSRSPARIHRAAPCLGQDTGDILTAMGMDREGIGELEERGVVRCFHAPHENENTPGAEGGPTGGGAERCLTNR